MCFPLSFPPGGKVSLCRSLFDLADYIFYFFFPSVGLPLQQEMTIQGHTLVASTDRPLSACHSHAHALKWQKEGQMDRAPLGYYTNITNVWKRRESGGSCESGLVAQMSRDGAEPRQTAHMAVSVCVCARVCVPLALFQPNT